MRRCVDEWRHAPDLRVGVILIVLHHRADALVELPVLVRVQDRIAMPLNHEILLEYDPVLAALVGNGGRAGEAEPR